MGGKIWAALFSHVPRSCLPLLNFHVLCVYSLKYTIGKDYMEYRGSVSVLLVSALLPLTQADNSYTPLLFARVDHTRSK